MNRNVLIGGIVVIAFAVGGWWYLNQSSAPATSEATDFPTTQQNTNSVTQPVVNNQQKQPAQTYTPPATTQTQPSASVTTKEYANSDYGISFSHPTSWQCKTYKTNSAHPDWYQTICDDDGVYSGDPLVAISVPFVAEDKDTWTKIRESAVSGKNSSVVTKTVYHLAGFGGSIGLVEYIFTGSASMKSYSLYALYGTGKPYATAEETEGILDHIVQSLLVE
jgi:hypothetical protein